MNKAYLMCTPSRSLLPVMLALIAGVVSYVALVNATSGRQATAQTAGLDEIRHVLVAIGAGAPVEGCTVAVHAVCSIRSSVGDNAPASEDVRPWHEVMLVVILRAE